MNNVIDLNKEKKKYRFRLTGNQLKWIALITMIIDHVGAFLIEPYVYSAIGMSNPDGSPILLGLAYLTRGIGRIAMPLFALLIAEGYQHTSNIKGYAKRLFVLALASEIPYDLARTGQMFDFSSQNILWSFLIAILVVDMFDISSETTTDNVILAVIGSGIVANLVNAEYNSLVNGLTFVTPTIVLYTYLYGRIEKHRQRMRQFALINSIVNILQFPSVHISSLLMVQYNGRKGKQSMRNAYWVYPIQFVVFYMLQSILIYYLL